MKTKAQLLQQIAELQNKRGNSNGVENNLILIDAIFAIELATQREMKWRHACEAMKSYTEALEARIKMIEATRDNLY